jgi:hypothetical protein
MNMRIVLKIICCNIYYSNITAIMLSNKTTDFKCLSKNGRISQIKAIIPITLSPYLSNISVYIYEYREQVKPSQFSSKLIATAKMIVLRKLFD